jgi:hypothetical protein
VAVWPARFGDAWRRLLPLIPHARLVRGRASTYVATYAEYRGAGRTKPREEPLAHRLGLSGSRRKRARLGGLGSPQRGLRFVRLEPSGDGQAGNRECPTPERNRPSPFLISAEKLDRFSSPEVRARIRRSRSEKAATTQNGRSSSSTSQPSGRPSRTSCDGVAALLDASRTSRCAFHPRSRSSSVMRPASCASTSMLR